jgi:hypothetical protein
VQHLYYIDTEDIENLPYYNKENRRLIYWNEIVLLDISVLIPPFE